MRRFLLTTAGAVLAVAGAGGASAETLREALIRAYRTNPTITGARADLRAQDENVPIARASGLPSSTAQGSFTETLRQTGNNIFAPDRQINGQATVSYPIIAFGAVKNSVRAAETRVEAGRANLRGTEANLFTDVVAAYMDVIRDEAVVALNQQNVRALSVNFQASRDRFEVGDLTRTDVAQSEARRALAEGQLRQAEAQLIASRENYIRIVGAPAGTLESPPALPNLPDTTATAVTTALAENPLIEAAEKARDATRYDTRVARTAKLPRISVQAGGTYYNFLNTLGSSSPVAAAPQSDYGFTAGIGLTLPLYQGGRPAAQVRQSQARESQAIEQVTSTERGVIAQVRSAYASWQSAQQVIASSEVAVNANRLSLEGVRAENSVGTRTILDILNAEQELLNSQVTLVTARRNAYVAGFALLAAMGRAEANDLNLTDIGSLYDPVANYDRVRRKIGDWGSDPEPLPVATRTVDTPAQTPIVGRNPELEDPALARPPGADPAALNPGTPPQGAPAGRTGSQSVDTTPANPSGTPR
ncbi:TolC family outer membrane protein [Sphingomonas sp. Leaf33]|uniref:TolC family outer membrane protein n=1 Tax=Sphingomonas sp. Leaf33 TaxID=1736215 RepID=UPI0009EC3647|nr:TolC family outer membrane protein [Sphingomonas sp. Leaf33]